MGFRFQLLFRRPAASIPSTPSTRPRGVIYLSVFDHCKIDLSRSYGCWKVCQISRRRHNAGQRLWLLIFSRNKRLSKGKKGIKKRTVDPFSRKDEYSVKVVTIGVVLRTLLIVFRHPPLSRSESMFFLYKFQPLL